MKAIASAIIGGTLLNGGVGNLLGAPIGTLTLLIINELIRAGGVQSNYQAIIADYCCISLSSCKALLCRCVTKKTLKSPCLPG